MNNSYSCNYPHIFTAAGECLCLGPPRVGWSHFGYKQGGDEALKAHSIFHHLFYKGAVDINKIEDPVKRIAAISFIHNFGQKPKQVCVCVCVYRCMGYLVISIVFSYMG